MLILAPRLYTGIKHTGAPWEFGLAGTHQAFLLYGSMVVPTTSSPPSLPLMVIAFTVQGTELRRTFKPTR